MAQYSLAANGARRVGETGSRTTTAASATVQRYGDQDDPAAYLDVVGKAPVRAGEYHLQQEKGESPYPADAADSAIEPRTLIVGRGEVPAPGGLRQRQHGGAQTQHQPPKDEVDEADPGLAMKSI